MATDSTVILDDGRFYIDLNVNYAPHAAPGFLQRRCYVGVTTPSGYECIGSFERDALSGKWRASIDVPYDEATGDSRELGSFVNRLDAIVVLWGARHQAHFRHAG